MVYKSVITAKNLNKGKPTDIIHDYPEEYFQTQFLEIFREGHYKGGLEHRGTFLDIGANIGLASLYFKEKADKIYALEPNPIYFSYLKENTKNEENIFPIQAGIGFEDGHAYLYSNPNEERMETIWGKGENKVAFRMIAIDTFFKENEIDHIDVLKIDSEGAEYPLFMSKGFAKVADKIDFIVGEGHYATNLMPSFIPTILGDFGFKVRFLPYKNVFNTYQLKDGDGKPVSKIYKTYENTIFEAYRE